MSAEVDILSAEDRENDASELIEAGNEKRSPKWQQPEDQPVLLRADTSPLMDNAIKPRPLREESDEILNRGSEEK